MHLTAHFKAANLICFCSTYICRKMSHCINGYHGSKDHVKSNKNNWGPGISCSSKFQLLTLSHLLSRVTPGETFFFHDILPTPLCNFHCQYCWPAPLPQKVHSVRILQLKLQNTKEKSLMVTCQQQAVG